MRVSLCVHVRGDCVCVCVCVCDACVSDLQLDGYNREVEHLHCGPDLFSHTHTIS